MNTKRVCKEMGVSSKALKIYEEYGIIVPKRDENGYRDYSEEDLLKLNKLIVLKEMEVPLRKIKELLNTDTLNEGSSLKDLQMQLMAADNRINELENIKEILYEGIEQLSTNKTDYDESLLLSRINACMAANRENRGKWVEKFVTSGYIKELEQNEAQAAGAVEEDESFVERYLQRIEYEGTLDCDISTLRRLQMQHLLTVPFENLSIFYNRKVEFSIKEIWNKIVLNRRGGVCYEINGLFLELLRRIGFNAKYVAAKVIETSSEQDHVFIIVNIDEQDWLVDVGFGDNFFEPIKLVLDEIQEDDKGYFKIVKAGEDTYRLLKSINKVDFTVRYTFDLQERKLEEFKERYEYFATSPESRFRKNRLCSIEKRNGRVSLTDSYISISEDGKYIKKQIDNERDFIDNLEKKFGIYLHAEG